MKSRAARDITVSAMIAALYAILGYMGNIFSLSYGAVQFRFAEAMTVLPFLCPAAVPGLAIGCFIVNLTSPFALIDMVFGTLATFIAAFLTSKVRKWYLAAFPPVAVNTLILPFVIAWSETGMISPAFWALYGQNVFSILISQTVVCYGLGTVLIKLLPTVPALKGFISERQR